MIQTDGHIPFWGLGRVNIVEITLLSKAVYRFNATSIKLLWYFSPNQNKKIHSVYGNTKDPEKQKQS